MEQQLLCLLYKLINIVSKFSGSLASCFWVIAMQIRSVSQRSKWVKQNWSKRTWIELSEETRVDVWTAQDACTSTILLSLGVTLTRLSLLNPFSSASISNLLNCFIMVPFNSDGLLPMWEQTILATWDFGFILKCLAWLGPCCSVYITQWVSNSPMLSNLDTRLSVALGVLLEFWGLEMLYFRRRVINKLYKQHLE